MKIQGLTVRFNTEINADNIEKVRTYFKEKYQGNVLLTYTEADYKMEKVYDKIKKKEVDYLGVNKDSGDIIVEGDILYSVSLDDLLCTKTNISEDDVKIVANKSELKFGQKVFIKCGHFYPFVIRKFGETDSGHAIKEDIFTYRRFLAFVQDAITRQVLYTKK